MSSYIDIILIGAVVITLIPTLFHYFQSLRKAKKKRLAEADEAAAHPAPTPEV